MSENETIVAVALRYKGLVFSLPRPKRHSDILYAMGHTLQIDESLVSAAFDLDNQGFLTSNGDFVRRGRAETIARLSGQLTGEIIGGELTSEDLW